MELFLSAAGNSDAQRKWKKKLGRHLCLCQWKHSSSKLYLVPVPSVPPWKTQVHWDGQKEWAVRKQHRRTCTYRSRRMVSANAPTALTLRREQDKPHPDPRLWKLFHLPLKKITTRRKIKKNFQIHRRQRRAVWRSNYSTGHLLDWLAGGEQSWISGGFLGMTGSRKPGYGAGPRWFGQAKQLILVRFPLMLSSKTFPNPFYH